MIALLLLGNQTQSEAANGYEKELEVRLSDVVKKLTASENVTVTVTSANRAKEVFSSSGSKDGEKEIIGAAIICEDKISNETKKEIITATSKILGIGSNHIFVGTAHID